MVKMPELPVIPEVISESYDGYARHVTKRRHARRPSPNKARKMNMATSREPQPDYFGLDNSMKNLTLSKPRKWRTRESGNGQKATKQSTSNKEKRTNDDEDKSSVASCDKHLLRKGRSFLHTKFKYPEKYHHPSRTINVQLEENIPQCLRKSPRYSNLPIRQACCYKPVRSVTQLRVHSVLSNCLPHPAPEQTLTRKRRPLSAPPRSLTSSFNGSSAFGHQRSSFENPASGRRHSTNDKTAIQHVTFDKTGDDVERNASFEYRYDEEEEEETHVTLEVEESDEEKNGASQRKSSDSSQDAMEHGNSIDLQNVESDLDDNRGFSEMQSKEVQLSETLGRAPSRYYSDDYDSELAKSVDSELDRL
ncbi:hypothetical protein LSH36_53g07030 [Paralvinella palmiformis]|uniref:Uncharacterized protein n=1 Tax=Paralvinella palmiformis TaxID=53620 RepID=A0AAD9K5U9_9ANNE|nr:hypothetical protein LSH36_53g07030 [Paralvinella palmiformis]